MMPTLTALPMNSRPRQLLILGAVLFLIGLLQGTVVHLFLSPRLALGAHIAAVQNGIVLMVFGLLWPWLSQSAGVEKLGRYAAIAGMYFIWLGFTVAALSGASKLLSFAGAGYSGSPASESMVAFFVMVGSGASIVAAVVVLLGLVRMREVETTTRASP
jgi:hydroxylaminobenzene mutase